jgi:hypothetical protein
VKRVLVCIHNSDPAGLCLEEVWEWRDDIARRVAELAAE